MSLAKAVRSRVPNLQNATVHELSSRGPFVAYLRRCAGSLSLSEYFDGVSPGEEVDGVRCEDVERLTFEAGKFDFRPGELTLWTGVNGHGKTTFLSNIMLKVMQAGQKVCLFHLSALLF